jgi:hypothetical protein
MGREGSKFSANLGYTRSSKAKNKEKIQEGSRKDEEEVCGNRKSFLCKVCGKKFIICLAQFFFKNV